MGQALRKTDNVIAFEAVNTAPADLDELLSGEDAAEAYDRLVKSSKKVHAFERLDEIDAMVTYFLDHDMYRTACFFIMGCNFGIRPSDILEFKWRWVLNERMEFDLTAGICESKTGKLRALVPNLAIQTAVEIYRDHCAGEIDRDAYMFVSVGNRTGHTPVGQRRLPSQQRVYDIRVQPVNIRTISRDMRDASRKLGLYREDRKISSYSLRSTAINAISGLVDDVPVSETAMKLMRGYQLAQLLGNHGRFATTFEHYISVHRRVLAPAIQEMNLGLNALKAFQTKGES